LTPHTVLDAIACPDCDLQQSIPPLPPGGSARCARCRVTLARNPVDPILRPLALTVAAAIVYIVANTSPLMGLSAVGREATTSIIGGAMEMWSQGSTITAAAVAFCAVIAPGTFIAFMLVVLLAALRPPAPRWVGQMLRIATFVEPWSMSEVMLLGILVALIKIAQLATVIPGIGMYAVGLLVMLLAAIASTFDTHVIWTRVVWADGTVPTPVPATHIRASATP
jgi:paraquat-inducible protein A